MTCSVANVVCAAPPPPPSAAPCGARGGQRQPTLPGLRRRCASLTPGTAAVVVVAAATLRVVVVGTAARGVVVVVVGSAPSAPGACVKTGWLRRGTASGIVGESEDTSPRSQGESNGHTASRVPSAAAAPPGNACATARCGCRTPAASRIRRILTRSCTLHRHRRPCRRPHCGQGACVSSCPRPACDGARVRSAHPLQPAAAR